MVVACVGEGIEAKGDDGSEFECECAAASSVTIRYVGKDAARGWRSMGSVSRRASHQQT